MAALTGEHVCTAPPYLDFSFSSCSLIILALSSAVGCGSGDKQRGGGVTSEGGLSLRQRCVRFVRVAFVTSGCQGEGECKVLAHGTTER